MGYIFDPTAFRLPNLLILTLLRFLSLVQTLVSSLFHSLIRLPNFLYPQTPIPTRPNHLSDPDPRSLLSVDSIKDLLFPVMKFADLVVDPPDTCTVCLYDFDGGDEIRQLTNCGHAFHLSCIDPWMDLQRLTCPLCRTPFVPSERVSVRSGISDFYQE